MGTIPTPRREPLSITQGDSASWTRTLPDFPSGGGYSLDYEIRGVALQISFQSTADTDGVSHDINLTTVQTAIWPQGQAILVGYVQGNGQRQQFYYDELTIILNLQGAEGDAPVKTLAQRMVEKIEKVLEGTADRTLLEERIGEVMFRNMTPEQLVYWHGYWVSRRRNEVALQRARNNRRTGTRIVPRAAVSYPGPFFGEQVYRGNWG